MKAINVGRRWSAHEDRVFRSLLGKVDIDLIAERLGRSVEALRCRRKRLGLSKFAKHDWTPEQIELVRRHPHGGSRKSLADALGLDIGRVGSMIAIVRRRERFAVFVKAA